MRSLVKERIKKPKILNNMHNRARKIIQYFLISVIAKSQNVYKIINMLHTLDIWGLWLQVYGTEM